MSFGAGKFYSKVVGQLEPGIFLPIYPHSSVLGINQHSNPPVQPNDPHSLSFRFKEFPFRASFPVPLSPPAVLNHENINKIDPVQSLVYSKSRWEFKKEKIARRCKNVPVPCVDEAKMYLDVPHDVFSLAEHVSDDPDKHFTGYYNWYYSGDAMDILHLGKKKYLLAPCFRKTPSLSIFNLKQKKSGLKINQKKSLALRLKYPQPVHQIECAKTGFFVRHRNACSFYPITQEDIINPGPLQTSDILSATPFVNFSLNKEDPKEVCTVTVNHDIQIWQLGTEKPLLQGNLKGSDGDNLSKGWASIYYIDENQILYSERKNLWLLDKRISLNAPFNKWSISDQTEICEEVYAVAAGSSLQYVSTSHSLFSLDLRKGFIQKWYHGIPNSPSLLCVTSSQDLMSDYVFVGSQKSDCLVSIQNTVGYDCEYRSEVLPYCLPSLGETLHQARIQGACLDPVLHSRFNFSAIGVKCLTSGQNELNILLCSAVGDIFLQTLKPRSDPVEGLNKLEDKEIQLYEKFERDCRQQYDDLRVTNCISEMSRTEDLLLSDNFLNPAKDQTKNNSDEKPIFLGQFTKSQLNSCCDYLSPKLLKSWRLGDMEEWHEEETEALSEVESEESDEECNITEKVLSWLSTNTNEIPEASETSSNCKTEQVSSENANLTGKSDECSD